MLEIGSVKKKIKGMNRRTEPTAATAAHATAATAANKKEKMKTVFVAVVDWQDNLLDVLTRGELTTEDDIKTAVQELAWEAFSTYRGPDKNRGSVEIRIVCKPTNN